MNTDEPAGMTWWNGLSDNLRLDWMQRAGNTGRASDAWAVYKRQTVREEFSAALRDDNKGDQHTCVDCGCVIAIPTQCAACLRQFGPDDDEPILPKKPVKKSGG